MPHFLPEQRIQREERFVKQNAPRLNDDGTGKGDALLLTAGQLVRIALFKVLQMYGAQRVAHSALQILCVLPRPQAERDVFKHRHVRPERKVLKHKAEISLFRRQIDLLLLGEHTNIVQPDFTLVRCFQTGDHPQKRCLAAAGRAEQRGKAPLPDRQRYELDDLSFIKALCNPIQSYFHSLPLFRIPP